MPQPANAFFGREADLAALRDLLARGERLVTVTGTGGVGKTRLVQQLVAQYGGDTSLAEEFCFCDLSEARDVDALCRLTAHALDVPLGTGPAVEAVGRALSARGRVLLLLDNFEQLVAPAADAVSAWLRLAPAARLLVTSRERLRLSEELVWELAPLHVPSAEERAEESEAVRLLIDRAQRIRRGYAPDEDEVRVLGELARKLDGLPLSLELAAARCNTLGPRALLERLSRRFEVLARGPRDASDRQATLRASLTWSWELLSPWERAALAQCAVFRGDFTLDAAEHVIDVTDHAGAPPPLDVVQSLREKSLLRAIEPAGARAELRLGLYVSVAQYAGERLDELGLRDATARRHAAYYVTRGEAWAAASFSADWKHARAELALDQENLLAVVEAALAPGAAREESVTDAARALLALEPLLILRASLPWHLGLLDGVIAEATRADVPGALLARLLAARATAGRRSGRMTESLRDLERGLSIAQKLGDPWVEACVRLAQGACLSDLGQRDAALAAFERAEACSLAAGSRADEALVAWRRGILQREHGQIAEALVCFRKAISLHHALGDTRREGIVLGDLGLALQEQGDLAEARASLTAALALHRAAGESYYDAVATTMLGLVDHEEGDHEAAAARYAAALRSIRLLGDRLWEAMLLQYLGMLCHARGELDAARTHLEAARAYFGEVDARPHIAFVDAQLGAVEATSGRPDAAAARLDAAAVVFATPEDPSWGVVELLRAYAELRKARAAGERGAADVEHAQKRAAHDRIAAVLLPDEGGADATSERSTLLSRSLDVRLSLNLLTTSFGEDVAQVRARAGAAERGTVVAAAADALLVQREGEWFRLPGQARVERCKRRAPRALLVTLAEQWLRAPGELVSPKALVEAAWPGERMQPSAARNRLHVAIAMLRGHGLREILQRQDGGYRLDPAVPVRFASVAEARAVNGVVTSQEP
ncbi:AAA family ATPase [Polyangium jinanense]|uniref:AAA family ATPase n=1 Tax=Polyangium jinanense TaxID=2829994 RepID=UPI00234252BF|nr:AAA family ATPase [Polyangium jinanense]MDC3962948.1 AAA family ATPase [Polyangium jinanense]